MTVEDDSQRTLVMKDVKDSLASDKDPDKETLMRNTDGAATNIKSLWDLHVAPCHDVRYKRLE